MRRRLHFAALAALCGACCGLRRCFLRRRLPHRHQYYSTTDGIVLKYKIILLVLGNFIMVDCAVWPHCTYFLAWCDVSAAVWLLERRRTVFFACCAVMEALEPPLRPLTQQSKLAFFLVDQTEPLEPPLRARPRAPTTKPEAKTKASPQTPR